MKKNVFAIIYRHQGGHVRGTVKSPHDKLSVSEIVELENDQEKRNGLKEVCVVNVIPLREEV